MKEEIILAILIYIMLLALVWWISFSWPLVIVTFILEVIIFTLAVKGVI